MRIVSLVPGITEFLFAIGAGDRVVGRSHACDHPIEATARPALTAPPTDQAPPASAGAILRPSVPPIDAALLEVLQPDLVIAPTQASVPSDAPILAIAPPHSFEEMLVDLERVGNAVAAGPEAGIMVQRLRTRLARLQLLVGERSHPRTAVIEWTAPLLAPGMWVPALVEAGGGRNVFGTPGGPATVADHSELATARPDVVLLAFSGLRLYEAQARLHDVMKHPQWRPATRASRILAIDAAAYVSRPGPRLVTGAELLAWALHRPHPVMQPPPGRIAELIEAGWVDLAAVRSPAPERAPG